MLDHELSLPAGLTPLTLKSASPRGRISRLLPCAKIDLKRSGQTCAVFLKRSRMSNTRILESLQKSKRQHAGTGRARNRRGSFLRLATISGH